MRIAAPDGGLWTSGKVAHWMSGELGLAKVRAQRGWEALKAIGWSIQSPRPRNPQAANSAQDVHCLVQCPAAPDRMSVQHHNGIFVPSDEGRTFSEIVGVEPSVFGFPVVVHPKEPDTAWFVPEIKDERRIPREGKLVVTRTRDGGKSFEALTQGLPQRHAYDVVYRHALTLDDAGDRLASGSTTGGLWVSENQGDSWACITHTLPPVYAVRFA
jgi:hypothetical protein